MVSASVVHGGVIMGQNLTMQCVFEVLPNATAAQYQARWYVGDTLTEIYREDVTVDSTTELFGTSYLKPEDHKQTGITEQVRAEENYL